MRTNLSQFTVGEPKGPLSNAKDGESSESLYSPSGKLVELESEAVAKEATDTNGVRRFWLKRGTTGIESGSLYNPQSPMFKPGSLNFNSSIAGRGHFEFRASNEECFNLYMEFLRTSDPIYLRQAERCI